MRRILPLAIALCALLAPAAGAQTPEPVIRPGVTVAGSTAGVFTFSGNRRWYRSRPVGEFQPVPTLPA